MAKTSPKSSIYTVTVGQAWKYDMESVVKEAGGRLTRGWCYTDESSTTIDVRVAFVGSASRLQNAIWAGKMGSCWVSVK